VRPNDLKLLDDLAKFPLTTKEDLRQNCPFGMFTVPMEQIVRIHASLDEAAPRATIWR
jgi:phenylacetate-CoA ligase